MADTVEREILRLPDFDDTEATVAFVAALEGESSRHGVKKLLGHCEAILGYKEKIAQNIEGAERALLVVNGIRTPLQAAKDKARSYRATAEAFYSTLTDAELKQLCAAFGVYARPDSMKHELVEHYVVSRLES